MTTSSNPTQPAAPEHALRMLYAALLEAWNRRDGAAMAALFAEEGEIVGFDGSQNRGPAEIAQTMDAIFAQHATAPYTGKVKSIRLLAPGAGLVRAIAGMVLAGQTTIAPELNSIQTLVTVAQGDEWRIALFQNTPAQFHGRPELVAEMTAELQRVYAQSAQAGEGGEPPRGIH